MTDVWSLARTKDGVQIQLERVPLWAHLAQQAGDWLLGATHPVFCCPPEWTWKVAWARPPADEKPAEDGYVYNPDTLGHALTEVAQRMASGFGAYRQYTTSALVPVSEEWVREHIPDAGWLFEDADEMHAAPGDTGDVQL